MRKVVLASKSAKERKSIKASSGSIEDMLDAFEGRIAQLENFDELNMATDIYEDEEDVEECGDIYSAEDVEAGLKSFEEDGMSYYETDPRNFMDEEDMLAEMIGSMLNLMTDYDMSLDEAAESWLSWTRSLIETAKAEIESGKAKSVYDR